MLIFDDYLHEVLGIISCIAFPLVCSFQTLSSPGRSETHSIVAVALQTGLKTAHFAFIMGVRQLVLLLTTIQLCYQGIILGAVFFEY